MADVSFSRRNLVKLFAAAAIAPVVATPAASGSLAPRESLPTIGIRPVALGFGWSLVNVDEDHHGALALDLVHSVSGDARVHACARGKASVGVAQSKLFDFVLMDGRDGEEATPEALGRAVMRLAKKVRAAEAAGKARADGLLTHEQRIAQYGGLLS